MELHLLKSVQATSNETIPIPVGMYRSLVIKFIDVIVPNGVNVLNGGLKIESNKYASRYDIVQYDHLLEFDNYNYGRIAYSVAAAGEYDSKINAMIRIPFELDEVKNSLAVGSIDEYSIQLNSGAFTAGTIRIFYEPTYHPMVYVPYLLPFNISTGTGEQFATISKPNVARIYGLPVTPTDLTYVCKNNQQVCKATGTELILSSCIEFRIEEDDTSMNWWMINTIPSCTPEELHNRIKVTVDQANNGTHLLYCFGFEDLDKAKGCTS